MRPGEGGVGHGGEQRFLRRLAMRLSLGAVGGEFDHLVLMAEPRALGMLRAALEPSTAARLEAVDPHDRTRDDANALRSRLREVRARMAA